jgi:spermidine synthase
MVLFFLSGATALVYEVIWSKYLGLMFGSTVHAQTVVLASFMGGLALGNWWLGSRADRLQQPLRVYGILECGIGVFAFFFQNIYSLADSIFVTVGSQIATQETVLLALKGGISLILLLPPTICMGGTLPLLAGWLQKYSSDAGRKSVRFYAINSLGAVCGAGLGGFFFVQFFGLVATLQFVGMVNIAVGLIALVISQRAANELQPRRVDEPSRAAESGGEGMPWVSAVALVTVTGAVSMGLEVLASRSLSLIFGASLQAFAIVLMAFILGIGLSGALISSKLLSKVDSSKSILFSLIGASALIGVMIFGFVQWVEIYRHLKTGIAPTEMGYRVHQIMMAVFSMVVLGIPAGLIGAVLPICLRSQGSDASRLGGHVGRLLTWNTIGAVLGVLLTGFVLMPRIGLRGAFLLLAGLLTAVALVVAISVGKRFAIIGSLVTTLGLLVVGFGSGDGWRHVMSSGVFRARETLIVPGTFDRRQQHVKLLFYEDAPDATVTVEEGDGIGAPADRGLRVNGKPDASRDGDLSSQMLVAHLPMLARPEASDVFVVGFGSGISAGSVLGHPVRKLDIAENCEPVLRAGKLFEEWNSGVLSDSRVRIFMEDARTVLKLNPARYDVIISQPSNPWMAGVGSIFSKEYYELASTRLKEGGIMAQWFQIYEMSDDIVSMVLRTFGTVFPHMEVWDASGGDLVLLGSHSPWKSDAESFRTFFDREKPRRDLARIGLPSVESVFARQFASQRTARAIAGEGGIQTDGFPVLEYEAPKAFFIGATAQSFTRFDERTWQQGLLSGGKREALRNLSAETIARALSRGSINRQLFSNVLKDSSAQLSERMPVALGEHSQSASDTNRWTILGISAEQQQRLSSDRHIEASEIQNLVDQYVASRPANDPIVNRIRAEFTITLARRCLACGACGDRESAAKLLKLGQELDPNSVELAYLWRVLNAG